MLVLGVDEAGRGPVIGPMIVCGLLVRKKDLNRLVELGVRDSKMLSPGKRVELVPFIVEVAVKHRFAIVDPEEIDRYVLHERLNLLEMEKIVEIIEDLRPDVVYVDAPGRSPKRFGEMLHKQTGVRVVAENHADRRYPLVGAASILAKVKRDMIIRRYHRIYGDFGSGYVGDPRTMSFLREYLRRRGKLPPIVRRSWRTCTSLIDEERKRTLSDFI